MDVSLSGSTAVIALLRADVFHVINVGDSRAVIGTTSKLGRVQPVQLSLDHKPDLPAEKARINAVGGRVLATRNKCVRVVCRCTYARVPGVALDDPTHCSTAVFV